MRHLVSNNNITAKKSLIDFHNPRPFDKNAVLLHDEIQAGSLVPLIPCNLQDDKQKEGILALDYKNGTIIDANSQIVEIIGFSLKEMKGKKLWEVGFFNTMKQSDQASTEAKTNGYALFGYMAIRRQNGKNAEVELTYNVLNVNGEKVIQCFIRDISEQKQMERKQKLDIQILSVLKNKKQWQPLINDICNQIKFNKEIGIDFENSEGAVQFFKQLEKTFSNISSEGKFSVSASKANEIDPSDNTAKQLKAVQSTNWNNKTVLIVEDKIFNNEYIEEILKKTKVKMLHALDGKKAVEHVKNDPDISLVLMDLKMPIMDGFEALQIIKRIRPKLPVIAQTAYAFVQDKARVLNAGFDNYISKPMTQVALLNLMAGYLN